MPGQPTHDRWNQQCPPKRTHQYNTSQQLLYQYYNMQLCCIISNCYLENIPSLSFKIAQWEGTSVQRTSSFDTPLQHLVGAEKIFVGPATVLDQGRKENRAAIRFVSGCRELFGGLLRGKSWYKVVTWNYVANAKKSMGALCMSFSFNPFSFQEVQSYVDRAGD